MYYVVVKNLRNNKNTLEQSKVITESGSRAFSMAGPTVWNSLPADLRDVLNISTFRTKLKTFFKQAYF